MTRPGIEVGSANRAGWEDLQMVLGSRGGAAQRECQRYELGSS